MNKEEMIEHYRATATYAPHEFTIGRKKQGIFLYFGTGEVHIIPGDMPLNLTPRCLREEWVIKLARDCSNDELLGWADVAFNP